MSYSTLRGAVFGSDTFGFPVILPQANLTGTNMSNTTGASFSEIDATGVNLSGATGVSFNFFGNFDDVNLTNADLAPFGLGDQACVSGNFTGADTPSSIRSKTTCPNRVVQSTPC